MFILSKSPGGHANTFQIKPWVAFGLPYLLIELFYIGIPVVRTDGRAGGRPCTVTWLPNFLGWVVYHISLPMVLRCARFPRESSAIIKTDALKSRRRSEQQAATHGSILFQIFVPASTTTNYWWMIMFLLPLLERIPTLYYNSFTLVSFGPYSALPVSAT